MIITSCDVRHLFRFHTNTSIPDLAAVAERLVRSGLVQTALTSHGTGYWLGDGRLQTTRPNSESASVRRPGFIRISAGDETIQRSLAEAAILSAVERQQFGQSHLLSAHHVRLDLGSWELVTEGETRLVRVTMKLYEHGSALLELGLRAVDVQPDDLIGYYINLPMWEVNAVYPPNAFALGGVLMLGNQASRAASWLYRKFPSQRPLALRLMAEHLGVDLRSHCRQGEMLAGFTHVMLPPNPDRDWLIRLPDLAISTAAFVLSEAVEGKPRLTFAGGRPHVVLTRFDQQAKTVAENERLHSEWLGKWLAKATSAGAEALTENTRAPSAEYAAYFNEATALWVWTTTGLDRSRATNPNEDWKASYLAEPHLFAEIIENGLALQSRFESDVREQTRLGDIAWTRRQILSLEKEMQKAGDSGEIREMLRRAWAASKGLEASTSTERLIQLQESIAHVEQTRAHTRLALTLTAIFGILTIPAFVKEFLLPIWVRFFAFPFVVDQEITGVFLTCLIMGALLSWILFRIRKDTSLGDLANVRQQRR